MLDMNRTTLIISTLSILFHTFILHFDMNNACLAATMTEMRPAIIKLHEKGKSERDSGIEASANQGLGRITVETSWTTSRSASRPASKQKVAISNNQ